MAATAPYFDSQYLTTHDRYVAWFDVMGSRSMMVRSLATIANFVFKLHVATLEAPRAGIQLYPMNDGVFGVGDNLMAVQNWLAGSFERIDLANQRANGDQTKVFMVRSAIAYGPVAEGRNAVNASPGTLDASHSVRDAIIIGAPVVNAFVHEQYASPFGIFVHESARTFAPNGGQPWSCGSFMRYWIQGNKPPWVSQIETRIATYLDYCEAHSNELEYKEENIRQHRILKTEYFTF